MRITAKSTRTKNRDEAAMKVGEWLKSGLPSGKLKQKEKRPVQSCVGLANILHAIRKTADLDTAGAMEIVLELKNRGLLIFL
jgi:hypothetical protein